MEFDDVHQELEIFEEYFYRDLETGWSVQRFYCERCFDDLISRWPLAYSARRAELQRAGIDLSDFYAGGRIDQMFSEADFDRLMPRLDCPNCGSSLRGVIYPYELPFRVPNGFEDGVEEIARLSAKAPFLLLTHPLCQDVLGLVKRISANAQRQLVPDRLYRARKLDRGVAKSVTHFDFAPAHVVAEGRYNHAGRPVLYAASSRATCLAEMRQAECLVLSFRFLAPLKTLDLVALDGCQGHDAELMEALSYSALASAPENGEGWVKPAYVFTRFLADCASFSGFDAIRYPSTRLGSQDGSYDLVILNQALRLEHYGTDFEYFETAAGGA